jgi:hypothetical protein
LSLRSQAQADSAAIILADGEPVTAYDPADLSAPYQLTALSFRTSVQPDPGTGIPMVAPKCVVVLALAGAPAIKRGWRIDFDGRSYVAEVPLPDYTLGHLTVPLRA